MVFLWFSHGATVVVRGLPGHQQSGGGGAAERHHRLASAHRGARSSGDGAGDDEAADRHDAWHGLIYGKYMVDIGLILVYLSSYFSSQCMYPIYPLVI